MCIIYIYIYIYIYLYIYIYIYQKYVCMPVRIAGNGCGAHRPDVVSDPLDGEEEHQSAHLRIQGLGLWVEG